MSKNNRTARPRFSSPSFAVAALATLGVAWPHARSAAQTDLRAVARLPSGS